jgi:hypothetical protein
MKCHQTVLNQSLHVIWLPTSFVKAYTCLALCVPWTEFCANFIEYDDIFSLQEPAPDSLTTVRTILELVVEIIFLDYTKPYHRQILSAVKRLHPTCQGDSVYTLLATVIQLTSDSVSLSSIHLSSQLLLERKIPQIVAHVGPLICCRLMSAELAWSSVIHRYGGTRGYNQGSRGGRRLSCSWRMGRWRSKPGEMEKERWTLRHLPWKVEGWRSRPGTL